MTDQAVPAPAHHPSRVSELYHRIPTNRLTELRERKPIQSNQMRVGFNGKVGLFITTVVGTMWAA